METSNFKKEPKVSIGCQIAESMKIRLHEEARRKGYSTFSPYLEKLIIDSFCKLPLKPNCLKVE